jgi:hypothetical protein
MSTKIVSLCYEENEETILTLLAINHSHECGKALRRRWGDEMSNASNSVNCIAHDRVICILGIVLHTRDRRIDRKDKVRLSQEL